MLTSGYLMRKLITIYPISYGNHDPTYPANKTSKHEHLIAELKSLNIPKITVKTK
jgi:hypothetical protein